MINLKDLEGSMLFPVFYLTKKNKIGVSERVKKFNEMASINEYHSVASQMSRDFRVDIFDETSGRLTTLMI
jgi:hypothetical protein